MAIEVPVFHVLMLAGILFLLGLAGVLVRRNIMFLLMSLEVMMNAAGLAFIAAGAVWGQPDGQIMFMFILALCRGGSGRGPRHRAADLAALRHPRHRRRQRLQRLGRGRT